MFRFIRSYSRKAYVVKQTLSPIGTSNASTKSFESLMPSSRRIKAWEKSGEPKDKYFKERFSHVHAAKKKWREENPDKIEHRQHLPTRENRRSFERKQETKQFKRDRLEQYGKKTPTQGLRPNPLSEYLYGTSTVLAALKSGKRDYFSRLIVHNPDSDKSIIPLARQMKLKVELAQNKNTLNILTSNAVHNGVVLETKPFTTDHITKLGDVDPTSGTYEIYKELYDSEVLNVAHVARKFSEKNSDDSSPKKFPLGIYLDEVTDPHNMGAIIRSAYFLGADFVVLSERNCSPISPVVAKTAVGATEFLPIYSTLDANKFFDNSKTNGWTFIAATSPTVEAENKSNNSKIVYSLESKQIDINFLGDTLTKSPVMLVLGSEGSGIRTTLKIKSDFIVSLDQGREVTETSIDSLNVSVAAALLISKILDGSAR